MKILNLHHQRWTTDAEGAPCTCARQAPESCRAPLDRPVRRPSRLFVRSSAFRAIVTAAGVASILLGAPARAGTNFDEVARAVEEAAQAAAQAAASPSDEEYEASSAARRLLIQNAIRQIAMSSDPRLGHDGSTGDVWGGRYNRESIALKRRRLDLDCAAKAIIGTAR